MPQYPPKSNIPGNGNPPITRSGWTEFFTYGVTAALTAGNGTVYQSSTVRIDSDADFEWHKTVYAATNGNIRVKFREESMGRYFIKVSADLRTIAGNFIGTPFILPRPYALLAGTNLTLEAADNSTVANTLRLAFVGGKRRPGIAPWEVRYRGVVPFIYSTDRNTVAALGNATFRIEVDNDAHFLIQKMTGFRQGTCLVEFREAARDRDWQNVALNFDTVIGNGQFPHVLFAPRFIPKGSVVTINVTDISGFANTVEINLIGVKMYE